MDAAPKAVKIMIRMNVNEKGRMMDNSCPENEEDRIVIKPREKIEQPQTELKTIKKYHCRDRSAEGGTQGIRPRSIREQV